MNIKQEVFSKITELAKEQEHYKIELALGVTVKEINAAYNDLLGFRNETNKYTKQAKDAAMGMSQSAKTLRVRTEEFLKQWELFQANVKGLGLDVPANIMQLGNIAKDNIRLANTLSKSAETITKASNV